MIEVALGVIIALTCVLVGWGLGRAQTERGPVGPVGPAGEAGKTVATKEWEG